jgi:ribosomal-protein-serine acetyltransferase
MQTVHENTVARIRPYEDDDVAKLFEAATESIAEMHPWLPWCHPAYSIEDSAGWVAGQADRWLSGSEFNFVIEDPRTGRFLGGVGLNNIQREHQMASLGYWVRTSAARRGVATAATLLCARFAFEQAGLTRVEIFMAVGNRASERVAIKCGARREGLLRNRIVLHGEAVDAHLFSLVPGDLSGL